MSRQSAVHRLRRASRQFLFKLSEAYAQSFSIGLSSYYWASFYSGLAKTLGHSFKTRQIFDNFHAIDPLGPAGRTELPGIEVVFASTRKDFRTLNLAIEGLRKSSNNPIESVKVVVPPEDTEVARNFLAADIVNEQDFLPGALLSAADRFSEIGRRGWVIQQLIGLYGAWTSGAAGVLVCDSDTILLASRTWIDHRGTQILSYSYEYHQPYEDHCNRIWGARFRHHGLSYVTHYMLMQPDIVRVIFPTIADLARWANLGDLAEGSAIADYHTYARWVVENMPTRLKMARWRNVSARSPDESENGDGPIRVPSVDSSYLSLSMHSYLS